MELHNIPTLLIWAKDDPIMPFELKSHIEETAKRIEKLYFDKLQIEKESWKAHSPENERPEQVNRVIVTFLNH